MPHPPATGVVETVSPPSPESTDAASPELVAASVVGGAVGVLAGVVSVAPPPPDDEEPEPLSPAAEVAPADEEPWSPPPPDDEEPEP
ncbi:MAG: hypothetical protein ACYDBR_04805 [Gaiellaceae bacterium]